MDNRDGRDVDLATPGRQQIVCFSVADSNNQLFI
jgi:hypothetical protein